VRTARTCQLTAQSTTFVQSTPQLRLSAPTGRPTSTELSSRPFPSVLLAQYRSSVLVGRRQDYVRPATFVFRTRIPPPRLRMITPPVGLVLPGITAPTRPLRQSRAQSELIILTGGWITTLIASPVRKEIIVPQDQPTGTRVLRESTAFTTRLSLPFVPFVLTTLSTEEETLPYVSLAQLDIGAILLGYLTTLNFPVPPLDTAQTALLSL